MHNFSGTNTDGFKAEVQILGDIYTYDVNRSVGLGKTINVAEVTIKTGKATIKHLEPLVSQVPQTIWGVKTNTFVKVKTVLSSPNHWDGEKAGLKHIFFMLENCVNPDSARGLYNEFLHHSLHEHRKVFELLGTKVKAPYSEN